MPTCPKCHKEVSWMHLDLFGGGCSACLGVDASAYEGLLHPATVGKAIPAMAS